jgi:precorrin-6B methylase 2
MNLFDLEPERPIEIPLRAWSFREARVLQVAVRFGLFDQLHEDARSAQALAQALGTDGEMTERLLVALSSLGLVIHDEGRWRNCLAATLYLVSEQPLYQGEVIRLAAEEWDRYHHLERMLREGLAGEMQERLLRRNTDSESYLKAVHAIAVAGQAQRAARLLNCVAARETLLDVAGAPGAYSVALCQRYPVLKATILDLAERRDFTESILGQAGVADRITFKEGDWREMRLGKAEYDVVRLGYLLGGTEAEALDPLMKAYEALKPGGVLVLQSFILHNDLNLSGRAAFINVLDSIFTLEQMQGLIAEASRSTRRSRHPTS